MSVPVAIDEGSDAYRTLRDQVIDRLEDKKIESTDTAEIRAVIQEIIISYQRRAQMGEVRSLRDADSMGERILTSITDFGALSEVFRRSDIEEIFIEGAEVAYIDGSGRLQGLTTPTSEEENVQVVERLLATTDRHLDTKSPIVQARVLGGSARLTASISPISDVLSATIRKHSMRRETLQSLVQRGTLSPAAGGFLRAAMHGGASMMIAGAPGTGKTTIASACIAAAPTHMCIRVCEEIRELNVPIVHGQYYEARPPSLDGTGEIGLRDLVKFTLSMRPDLIVVGEVRGAEAFELTRAVNAGCGFMCTVHSNSASDALEAIVNAAIMSGENISVDIVRKVFASSLDLVVFVDRESIAKVDNEVGIRRQVMEILAVQPSLSSGGFTVEPIFTRRELGAPLEWSGSIPPVAERLERALPSGVSIRNILSGQQVFL